MTTRTRTTTLSFSAPFALAGFDGLLPAGSHVVETDEELLQGLSFMAWHRTLTLLHLRPATGSAGHARTLVIDPLALDAALSREQARAAPASPAADRIALERAENEGMSAPAPQPSPM
jgi:hypothetical protein